MATANEEFFEAMIRHQIGLMRLSGGIRNDVWALLDATEGDIRRAIERSLAGHGGITNPQTVKRMNSLLKFIGARRLGAWQDVDALWLKDMTELVKAQPGFVQRIMNTVSPVVLDTTLPAVSTLTSLITTRPFEGKLLKQWSKNIAAADLAKISQEIRIGVVRGESARAIAARVVGTAALGGGNGATAIARRNAETITRTAVNHFANQANREFYEENIDILDGEQYMAVLDTRTTEVCMGLDGQIFPVGKGPYPPLHHRCRSVRVGVLNGVALGPRPFVAATEKQLVREFSEKNNLGGLTKRANLPHGTKGAFDKFSRTRVRELTGQVPGRTTYSEFLRNQSVEFQEETLGVAKAKLFREGNLELTKFVDGAGNTLSLSELAVLHGDAFEAAGLDPAEFR